jgi:nicotinate-nucleotide pyrophosphorylase (carboxylating)
VTAPRRNEIAISVGRALIEDLGSGDITASLIADTKQFAQATVLVREPAVLCGREWFDEVYRQVDPRVVVDWHHEDGAGLAPGRLVCTLSGPVQAILTGERTALNFLQTLSGTASHARRFVDAVAGTRARILDTRKTIPGLRRAQKYAVACGGAENHRMGLFDAFLIKENHIEALGSLSLAVERAVEKRAADRTANLLIEVEIENLDQVNEAFTTAADRLLLDNFTLDDTSKAVAIRDAHAIKGSKRKELESSGNVTLDQIRAIAETGVDWISVGAMTKNVHATDYSMRIT